MDAPVGPFKIPAINDFIPEKVKPWIFILFVLIIQFAGGGIYLATLNESVGERALMQEDIMMAGFASMAGMCLVFSIMLRLKLRFITKYALITCCIALIACNIVCLYTDNVFILIAACFIAGMFRMWATFECNSTIQLWITPSRDMPIFFSYVYLLVNGVILLGGVTDMYVALFANVAYVNWLVVGLLLFMLLVIVLIFNNVRFIPKFPLFGVDWLGAILWGLILLNINFILIYGSFYDWFHAEQMRVAAVTLVLMLAMNIYRASFIRHPFIPLQTFCYRPVWRSLILYSIVDLLIGPSHIYEHIYFEKILGYDHHQMIWVNVISWLGILAGGLFAWRYFAIAKKSPKSTYMIALASIVVYNVFMYFFIDHNTSQELIIIPLILRNFGYVIVAIVLISDLMKVPFHHFFQSISVQAFMSAACGAAIGTAILNEVLKYVAAKNFMLASSAFDKLNHNLQHMDGGMIANVMEQHVLMVSLKEIYGYIVIGGILVFILLLLYKNPLVGFSKPSINDVDESSKQEVSID